MIGNIIVTGGLFVILMLTLLYGMQQYQWFRESGGVPASDLTSLTLRQGTIFFTVYVFFQVWNLLNCRSLTPSVSGLSRLTTNRMFWLIVVCIILGQVGIVTFGGVIFQVTPLAAMEWLVIALSTSSVLLLVEMARHLRMALRPYLPGRS